MGPQDLESHSRATDGVTLWCSQRLELLSAFVKATMDRSLIEEYARGATRPAEAIAGLTPSQLNAEPVPGTWSIQQIVLHLMDSDLVGSDRMKRVIAEREPQLIGYDE